MIRHLKTPVTNSAAHRPARRHALRVLGGCAAGLVVGPTKSGSADGAAQPTPKSFDPALLDRAAAKASRFEQIRSIIISRSGEIAYSEAFRGPALERAVNIKSVSKSFVSSMIGAAIDRGLLDDVNQQLGDAAPDLIPEDAEPGVSDLTIAHFLSMQSGLKRTSGPNYGRWVESRNWVAYALAQPFIAPPGSRMLYSTGNYHVLGALLARISGKSLLALSREWIGDPLGIDIPSWNRDPQGFYFGGNNMRLSPLDMLRFGEMHRLGGVWNGARVLSADWIANAWTARTASPYSGDGYGLGWFVSRRGGHDFVYARGYGGQMIYIVPDLEITVAVTSDATRPARSQGYAGQLRSLLIDDIIPAAV